MIHFIANEKSGKGNGGKALKILAKYCRQNDIDFTAHITTRAGHATEIASALCERGAEKIVAVGGDGTFSEVLNGIADPLKTPLGFIPAGRGNDYACAAGLSLKPLIALKLILDGKISFTDYMTVGNKRCLNVAGTGLDTAVLERVEKQKKGYLSSLLYCVGHFTPYKLNVTLNGEITRHECIMAGVCNGRFIGGGMTISPKSLLNDGKLDVVIIRIPTSGKIMPALFKFRKGGHIDQEYTTHIVCDEVSILPAEGYSYPIQIDGEILYDAPLTCKAVKGGLKTFGT